MQLLIERAERGREIPPTAELGFGKYFSDHMFLMDYTREGGWHSPRIVPFQPFSFDPSSLVLHYGQSIFEGQKAYRWEDGSVNLFRAQDHINRFARSADRLVMPEFDKEFVMNALLTLLDIDRKWVPEDRGTALYIRPTLIATENMLGVRPANEYRMFIITSPVGSYYARGMAPTRILVEERYSRVPEGGTGAAKTAGNYAASLKASAEARKLGYDQVLWLDAKEHRYIEEVGTMNVFFVIDNVLITPPLGGTILDGVTRRSVITLARDWGIDVQERRIRIDEVMEAYEAGDLQEAFGSGTAAVISPIGTLGWLGEDYEVNERENSLRQRLYDEITAIQYGETEDTHGWMLQVPKTHSHTNGNGHHKPVPDEATGTA
ncbi:MAG: branched-chain amino acid aminotransferase [Ignavibacteriae bacterium]|nr:branched-chain amino acid aminotransferase [Ignavibacteriota bacterium]MCB9214644.1 branched-chain amino acid aminotransferase [Ignavibacteria bacterium]